MLGSNDQELYRNISRANMINQDKLNNNLKEFFKKIFIVDENQRPSSEEIMELSYFKNI